MTTSTELVGRIVVDFTDKSIGDPVGALEIAVGSEVLGDCVGENVGSPVVGSPVVGTREGFFVGVIEGVIEGDMLGTLVAHISLHLAHPSANT